MVKSHIAVAFPLTLHKPVVSYLKLIHFHFFVGKGFHHPDAGKVIFNLGVDIGNPGPVFYKGAFHLNVEVKGIDQHNRNDGKGYESQPPVDGKENGKGANQLNNGNDNILGAVVEQLADFK